MNNLTQKIIGDVSENTYQSDFNNEFIENNKNVSDEIKMENVNNSNVVSDVSVNTINSGNFKENKEMENKMIQTFGSEVSSNTKNNMNYQTEIYVRSQEPRDTGRGFVINDKRVVFENENDFFTFFCELHFDLITDGSGNVIVSPHEMYGFKEVVHFDNLFNYFGCNPFNNNDWLEIFDDYPLKLYKIQEVKLINSFITG